ncbi:MAG: peptidylprolyl isomerase [Rhodospirillales bacterium]|nr:peptidylprolyl isomerase [Rhodospirillales bacterium]
MQNCLKTLTAAITLSLAVTGPLQAQDNPVAAEVNGVKIMLSDVVEAQRLLPEQYRKIPFDQIFPTLLDSVIDSHLSAADARKQGLHKEEAFKKEMQRIERQLLQRNMLTLAIAQQVTDEAVKAAYDKLAASSAGNAEIHARHILLKTEAEATAVIAELDKGKDFAELAKTKSTGPSGPNGGDLGFFGRGQMVPAFEKAAFELEKGMYSTAPVKTQFGYHVILQEDKRQKAPPSFAEAEPKLRAELSQQAGGEYMGGLRKVAKIEKFLPKPAPAAEADKPATDADKKAN